MRLGASAFFGRRQFGSARAGGFAGAVQAALAAAKAEQEQAAEPPLFRKAAVLAAARAEDAEAEDDARFDEIMATTQRRPRRHSSALFLR